MSEGWKEIFKDKKVLLAICGSVSFYKSYELLSSLKKLGAKVRVLLSPGVLSFANPLSFEALCDEPILHDLAQNWQAGLHHINYAKCDLAVIAPASANSINKLANGIADNVFIQTLLACRAPLVIAPAANDAMLEHFSTKSSLELLAKNGTHIVAPEFKKLACGDFGKGGLATKKSILYACAKMLSKQSFKGEKILITAGPTSEKIDPVRAITNSSSGKMGQALADAFYFAGADVELLSSLSANELPYPSFSFYSSADLAQLLKQRLSGAKALIMCAAVSDFIPAKSSEVKIKKSAKALNLELKPNIDILSELKEYPLIKVGFKLESEGENAKQKALDMLKNKGLDAVCLNIIGKNNPIGSELNEVIFISKTSSTKLALNTKPNIARQIAELVSQIL